MAHDLKELKSQLIPLYAALRNDCNSDDKLAPFIIHWGDKFPTNPNEGIIFYGRATNGWGDTWDLIDFETRSDLLNWVEDSWKNPDVEYDTSRSQFWGVIKGVSKRFYGDEWFKYVAWSNIWKVAPGEEGNPSVSLIDKTSENNKKVFRTELDFWSPKYIVLFTGEKYRSKDNIISDYIACLNNNELPPVLYEKAWDEEYPEVKIRVYKVGDRYIILSLHPQGLKVGLHADAIIEVIENIEQNRL